MLDYRSILKRYIDIVSNAEGVNFIGKQCPDNFAPSEWEALLLCALEADDEWAINQGLKRG